MPYCPMLTLADPRSHIGTSLTHEVKEVYDAAISDSPKGLCSSLFFLKSLIA